MNWGDMMADRYLTPDALERALSAGHDIEQWLGARIEGPWRILKWLSIEHGRDGTATLRISEVLDDGRPDFIDIYEFTPYDAEAEDGVTYQLHDARSALECAISQHGASLDRFVNQGLVQLEYADYLKAGRNVGSGSTGPPSQSG